jgi:hypothetical protein
MPIRLIKDEAVPKCGSIDVRFPDAKPSGYFYRDDLPGRRLRPDILSCEATFEQPKPLARPKAKCWIE